MAEYYVNRDALGDGTRPVHRDSCAQLPALNTLLYLDMLWLAQQGHDVIGVELSPVAVRDFFAENSMRPQRQRNGKFTLWQSGHISNCVEGFAYLNTLFGNFGISEFRNFGVRSHKSQAACQM